VLAELQANTPGMQGPVRRVADAKAEAEVEVTMTKVLFDVGTVMVDAGRVVNCELSTKVVLEKGGNCEDGEGGLPEDVVLENIGWYEDDVADEPAVVSTVAIGMTAKEETLVADTKIEDGVRLTKIVVATVKTSTKINVEVDCIAAAAVVVDDDNDVVVLGKNNEAIVDVVFASGPDVVFADGTVVLTAVLFEAYPEPVNPVPLRGG
jgi:hypothetical protein